MKKSKFKAVLSRFCPEDETYQSQLSVVCEAEFENQARAFRLDWPKASFLLVTDPAHAFFDLQLAMEIRASLLIDGNVIRLKGANSTYFRLRLRHAGSQDHQLQAAREYSDYLLSLIPSRSPYEQARLDLCHALDKVSPVMSDGLKDCALSLFDYGWSEKKRKALRLISVDQCNPAVESVITDLTKLMEMLGRVPGIYVIAAPMGWGKTSQIVLPLFDRLKERKDMPVLAAPRRSHLYPYQQMPAHYQNWWNTREIGNDGLMTVTNSLFLSFRFRLVRERTRAVIFDEYELIRSHHAGEAIGTGSLIDRATLISAEERMVRSILEERRGTVLYVDALMSDATVSHIGEVTGKRVHLFQPETPLHNGNLFVYPSRQKLVARIKGMLKENKSVAVISDIAHREATNDKLQALHDSCSAVCNGESLLLDATKFSKLADSGELEQLDSVIDGHQLVTISPVLSSAASLTTSHFDAVFVIASGAILPNELLQCFRRFRAVPDVHLSLPRHRNTECRSEAQLFYKEIAWMPARDEVRFDSIEEIRRLPGVQSLLQRKLHEQNLRSDYCDTTLIIAESLGYRIVRTGCESPFTSSVSDDSDVQLIVNERNARKIVLARHIGSHEAQKVCQGRTALSEESRFELRSFQLRDVFGDELCVQLVLDDCNGKLRGWIKVFNSLFVNEMINEPLAFRLKVRILEKLCLSLRFDPRHVTFIPLPGDHPATEIGYLRTDANEFQSWLLGGPLGVPGCEFTCLEAFEIAFPWFGRLPKLSVTLAKKLLVEELGFKVEPSSRRACLGGKDYWAYRVMQSDLHKKYSQHFGFH